MRKPAFCIYENKSAYQQLIRVCIFATYTIHSSTSFIQNFKSLSIFCDCTVRFMSDLVGNTEDRFSRDTAQMIMMKYWSGDAHEDHLRLIAGFSSAPCVFS